MQRKAAPASTLKLVDKITGEPTLLEDDELLAAIEAKTVITRKAFTTYQCKSELVDAEDGQPTTLVGDELALAKNLRTVITRGAYYARRYNNYLVNATDGKRTTLEGEALLQAIEEGTVIKKPTFQRKRNQSKQLSKPMIENHESVDTQVVNSVIVDKVQNELSDQHADVRTNQPVKLDEEWLEKLLAHADSTLEADDTAQLLQADLTISNEDAVQDEACNRKRKHEDIVADQSAESDEVEENRQPVSQATISPLRRSSLFAPVVAKQPHQEVKPEQPKYPAYMTSATPLVYPPFIPMNKPTQPVYTVKMTSASTVGLKK